MSETKGRCAVCKTKLSKPEHQSEQGTRFDCPHCGHFFAGSVAVRMLPKLLESDPDAAAKICHALHRSRENNPAPEILSHTLSELLKRPLPRPREQADLMIRFLAKNSKGPGKPLTTGYEAHGGVIGASSMEGFGMIIDHLIASRLATEAAQLLNGSRSIALSFDGWEHYETLKFSGKLYRRAFMAMKFGDSVLNQVLEEVFRPAVKQAGFDLFKLDDVPKAGLIDDRLRVEIQSSDFLIADLSHANAGAYWEAGYAEGLGKPVIYTCEQEIFKTQNTHFDTNHHLTVIWTCDDPHKAAEQLKATIRATLPHIAKLQDDDV